MSHRFPGAPGILSQIVSARLAQHIIVGPSAIEWEFSKRYRSISIGDLIDTRAADALGLTFAEPITPRAATLEFELMNVPYDRYAGLTA